MATARENFDSWFAKIIRNSYDDDDAGYVRVMVAFPLLERYVRLKVQCFEVILSERFHDEIARLIPKLESGKQAKDFWRTYRHRLLHNGTSEGWLSGIQSPVLFSNGSFQLNSVKFAERVLEIIEGDFATFEGKRPEDALPEVVYQHIPLTNDMGIGTRPFTGTAQPSMPGTVIITKTNI
jgi:hypothetical protein